MEKWQYGIVIDAGSSGSRIHVYRWFSNEYAKKHANKDQFESLPDIQSPKHWTKKIRPGVSTFGKNPSEVGPGHLRSLLEHALEIVPEDQISDTPVFLLATAGVRLLPSPERKDLLREICNYTRDTYDFLLPDCDLHVQEIPGETEGLYGWIAANYLLGGFDNPQDHEHGKGHHTYGFLDMGGASAQIAFAPNSTEAQKHANDLKLLRLRNVNGAVEEYRVFVSTWLRFGVHEARRRYVDTALEKFGPSGKLSDPCLPKGLITSIPDDNILTQDEAQQESAYFYGTGEFAECLKSSYPLLGKDKPCQNEPCLLDGIPAPAIDFDINHFVGVSEYWHTTHEVFEMGHKDKAYDFTTYQERVTAFCTSDWGDILKGLDEEKWGEKVDERTAMEVCFKANWIINVLHDGIGIPRLPMENNQEISRNRTKQAKDRGFTDSFQSVHKIDGQEVSWTLGKMVLYATSKIPPGKGSALPVGFGSNVESGVSEDFQYPSIPFHQNATINSTQVQVESWREQLFEGKSPRRVPGFVLFLLIVCIAMFLLCGKERRSRFYGKVFARFTAPGGRFGRRKGGLFAPKVSLGGASERLLESGIRNPDDFELGDISDEEYSDDSAGKTGKTSGWATPRIRGPHLDGTSDDYLISGGNANPSFGLGINAMERSGLFPRTESRESLYSVERGRKSRRGSPTRHKSPLMSSVAED